MGADSLRRPSFMAMLVVGSPERGLVGIGRGRGNTTIRAMDAGFHKGVSWSHSHSHGRGTTILLKYGRVSGLKRVIAVQSLDFVNKYEGRTLWSSSGDDISSRFGATTVILRARPAGMSP